MPEDNEKTGWKIELRKELVKIVEHFTTDRYPSTVETQRAYEQRLNMLQDQTFDDLRIRHEGEDAQFREDFKRQQLQALNQEERESWKHARTALDQAALRAGQLGDRQALERGDFRDSAEYKERREELQLRQNDDFERVKVAFAQVEDGLNERFGFTRQREDPNDRSR